MKLARAIETAPIFRPLSGLGPGKTRAWREARSLEPRLGNGYERGVLRPDRCRQASLITFQGARPSCRAFVYVVTAALSSILPTCCRSRGFCRIKRRRGSAGGSCYPGSMLKIVRAIPDQCRLDSCFRGSMRVLDSCFRGSIDPRAAPLPRIRRARMRSLAS